MDTLKRDPRALEIFLDELALADKTQPKHLRFFAGLQDTVETRARDGDSKGRISRLLKQDTA